MYTGKFLEKNTLKLSDLLRILYKQLNRVKQKYGETTDTLLLLQNLFELENSEKSSNFAESKF